MIGAVIVVFLVLPVAAGSVLGLYYLIRTAVAHGIRDADRERAAGADLTRGPVR